MPRPSPSWIRAVWAAAPVVMTVTTFLTMVSASTFGLDHTRGPVPAVLLVGLLISVAGGTVALIGWKALPLWLRLAAPLSYVPLLLLTLLALGL